MNPNRNTKFIDEPNYGIVKKIREDANKIDPAHSSHITDTKKMLNHYIVNFVDFNLFKK